MGTPLEISTPGSNTSFPWKNPWVQGAVLILLLLFYLYTKHPLFGAAAAVVILLVVFWEVKEGAQSHGWKTELLDTLKALLAAVALWFVAGFLLHTSAPLSAVASCSMLPNLQRGDFVVVQGTSIQAPEIVLTPEQFQGFLGKARITYADPAAATNQSAEVDGSLFSYCDASADPVCTVFRQHPQNFIEQRGPLTFHYDFCSIQQSGQSVPCVRSVEFEGTSYPSSTTTDTVVYTPDRGDVYALIGDIVHRSQLVLNVDGQRYYLTKGDNNPIFDAQVYSYGYQRGNLPVAQDRVKGKVLMRVPLLGYFKLFISGLFQEDAQCGQQLVY